MDNIFDSIMSGLNEILDELQDKKQELLIHTISDDTADQNVAETSK